ncbi:MAG: hypothetical protein HRU06_06400 [Oceanospirillaceae bacterium]|nr:hypothetical protein [Oceanospirillaceae bacterium]
MRIVSYFSTKQEFKLPKVIIYSTIALCIVPFLLQMLGVDFGNALAPIVLSDAPLSVDQMFYQLAGGFTHALLEWTAFCAAIFVVLLSFCHYSITKDITTPVIGVALFCAGAMDAFHTLAATRLVSAVAANTDLIPFTWALSRVFNALIMIIGVGIFLRREQVKASKGMLFIVMTSLAFSAVGYLLIYLSATTEHLPQTQFPDALIRRPYDIVPLILFIIAGLFIYPMFLKKHPSIFAAALLLSALPEVAVEMHMAFGSKRLFDSDFNVAHVLKIIAYVIPLSGLVLDYILTYKRQEKHHELLIKAHDKLNIRTREMRKLNQKLSLSNSELEKFAYIASHDLQEPLRKIQAFGDRLNSNLDKNTNAKALDYISRMQKSSTRMRGLIDDLLLFSKLGYQEYTLKKTDLNAVVTQVQDDLQLLIADKKAKIEVKLLPQVLGESKKLYQVFLNLINNSLKFSQEGVLPVITISSEEAIQNNKAYWKISVQDNGIGFDLIYKNKIFEVFQRLHGRSQYEGTGIGLAICKKIIEKHNGSITVVSEPGKGSCFILWLEKMESEDVR